MKKDQKQTPARARREMLQSGAAAAASALLGVAAVARADDDAPASPGAGGNTRAATRKGAAEDADIAQLNALLTSEYGAITAYTAGADLISGAPTSDPLYAMRELIGAIAADFQAQHRLHAEALVEAIASLGGTPVSEEAVAEEFSPPDALVANPSITNVLKYAASAERSAAVSYNKVVATLEAARFRFLASSIEGDESQHFIVLAALVLGLAAPGENLGPDTTDDVVPEAFVATVGEQPGLDQAPPNYFA